LAAQWLPDYSTTLRHTASTHLAPRLSGPLAPKTIENVFKLVRATLASAVDDGLKATSPCRKIARQEVTSHAVLPLELPQVEALIEGLSFR
jgi:hypothetical protein